jgi:hypothetical protein
MLTVGLMHMLRHLPQTSLLLLLAACAGGTPIQVSDVKIASAEMVTLCRYVDTVYGTSSWYGVFAEKGVENARLSAFAKARSLSGTHIVWEALPQTHGSSIVAAKVYVCSK